MYEKYMLLLEEEAKIRNLKNRSILCYKNYVRIRWKFKKAFRIIRAK